MRSPNNRAPFHHHIPLLPLLPWHIWPDVTASAIPLVPSPAFGKFYLVWHIGLLHMPVKWLVAPEAILVSRIGTNNAVLESGLR